MKVASKSPDLSRERVELIEAWRRVGGERDPESVETIQAERTRSVYRLKGVGSFGRNVVAKRSPVEQARREAWFHSKVLPALPLPIVGYLGYSDDGEDVGWIFIDEVEGSRYSPVRWSHRTLAAETLGYLHVHGADIGFKEELLDRGPSFYRQDLIRAIQLLSEASSGAGVGQHDLPVIEAILGYCEAVSSHWEELVHSCARIPPTVVHGDFKEDNLVVRNGTEGKELVLFDWHEAGWGIPALDHAKFLGYSVRPRPDRYCEIVGARWPWLDLREVLRIGYVGELFRCLASIRWLAERLRYGWIEGPMTTMRVYQSWLREIIEAVPWSIHAPPPIENRFTVPRTWN